MSQTHTRENVQFAQGLHTVEFVARNNRVVAKVTKSALRNPAAGRSPVFPVLVVSREGDLYTAHVRGQEPKLQVWARTPARAFARAVTAFWTVRGVRKSK